MICKHNKNSTMSIFIIQKLIFIIPLIAYAVVKNFLGGTSILIPYLFCIILSGFVINLGNTWMSSNVETCIFKVSVKDIKNKSFIYNTSEGPYMSKVDYIFQKIGYILILISIFYFTILVIISRKNSIIVLWTSMSDVYSSLLMIYLLFVAIFSALIRISLYLYEKYFCKNSTKFK
ncbi:MAG: hypothetical protein JEZ05_04845 [Tenericutes bacterium]|nr:hypothetical protein [Mycoplasmatota bacterium]